MDGDLADSLCVLYFYEMQQCIITAVVHILMAASPLQEKNKLITDTAL